MSVNASALDVFRVLRLVGTSDDLLRATDISNRLGITHSITRRAIATLVQAGYLQRHQHWGRFEVGFAARQLGNALVNRFPIRQAAIPVLRELAVKFRGTASLSVRLGWYSIRLASIEGGASLFIHARKLGDPTLLGTTKMGSTMLAGMEPNEIERYFRFASAMLGEKFSAKDQSKLEKELSLIRKTDGFIFADVGNHDLTAVIAVLRDQNHSPIATVSVESTKEYLPGKNPEKTLAGLTKIVRGFEKRGQENPGHFNTPFAHLDPDEIRFGLD